MKKLVKSLKIKNVCKVMAFALLLFFANANNVWAGYGADVAKKIATYVEIMESVQGNNITKINSALLTKEDNVMSYTARLYRGNDYTIYAFGDERISDTDLTVYRKNSSGEWVQVAKDADSSNLAIVKYTCTTSGEYKFTIKAYSFKAGYTRGYYGLVIGWKDS